MGNRYKTTHYKSSVQFYGTTPQEILATTLITNPLTLALGNRVTDTGCAIDFGANDISIESNGLYRASADVEVVGTTAGDVTFALTLNGEILPETLRTVTLVAGASQIVPLETVRNLNTCCQFASRNIGIIAFSDIKNLIVTNKNNPHRSRCGFNISRHCRHITSSLLLFTYYFMMCSALP